MCGICGFVKFDGRPLQKELIHKMCTALVHRGPDGEGIYMNPTSDLPVGLGHRRLKIIDLSEAGHQPMANEDKTVWIVFNGEIYNYRILREELESNGHTFKSNTDTETILHLYEKYGEDCVKYLHGMFAFAIWDEKKQILLMARDRLGKKPLIYYYDSNTFCFASEFSSLLASGLIDTKINQEAIHYYLTFGYIPAPLTIYENVYKLLPAHRLILKGKKISLSRYWQLDYAKKIKISENEAAEEVLRLLKEAVKIRLYSDVPLGAFLSGGIDSSTVVALMAQITGKRIKTFSIGFEEKDYSELKYARNIAERFNTEHNEFIVRPKALEVLPLLVEHYGEPYADPSSIPTYYVAQQTKRYVTVALNGDGGDELFAGYERYQAMLAAEIYQKLPKLVKIMMSNFIRMLPDSVNSKNRLRRIKRFFDGAALPLQKRYLRWVGIFDDSLKESLYSEDFKDRLLRKNPVDWLSPYINSANGLNIVDSLLMADTNTYLPNDLLVKVDITCMANSLEARSPFLDHRLIEFVSGLPVEYKLKGFIKKYIFKKAIKNLIPQENIHRSKMGFGVPIGHWFRGGVEELLHDTLLTKLCSQRGYFKLEVIKDMIEKHLSKQADYTLQLWTLLMLELWHKRFIY